MTRDTIREAIARAIYERLPFLPTDYLPHRPPWVEGGNSQMQMLARSYADVALAAIEAAGAVVVPRDLSGSMVDEVASNIRGAGYSGDSYLLSRVIWSVGLRASPYRRET